MRGDGPMTARPEQRRHLDVSSLLWGIVFALIAGIAGWMALGHHVDWSALRFTAPLVLIALGILGLVLSRPNH